MSETTCRKTYKEKLRPTPEQERALDGVLWQCRALYNTALEQRSIAWQRRRLSVSRFQQEAELKDIRAEFPDYAAINARNGTLRWRRILIYHGFQEVVDDDTIFIGTTTQDGKLLQALRAQDGSEIWHVLLPSTNLATNMQLAISNGIIFMAFWDDMPPPHEHLFAIQATNGTRLWETNIGQGNVSSVGLAVRSDLIYALTTSQDGTVIRVLLEACRSRMARSPGGLSRTTTASSAR
jgi:PQQ-like domain/Helix-turn-helix domain